MIKNSDVLLEVDDTLMEGLISEIYEISEEEFKETKTWLKDMEKDSRLLAADVLIDIPPPSKAILKNKIVIGVDAGSAQRSNCSISSGSQEKNRKFYKGIYSDAIICSLQYPKR